MSIINTRSPFHLTVTDGSLSYATLDIEIYSGTKTTDATGTPTYSLRKQSIGFLTSITFEVSDIIKDYIDLTYDTSELCVWVDTTLKGYDSSDTELSSKSETYLAFNSYSYFEENDFDFSNNSLLMSTNKIIINGFNDYKIPFYNANNTDIIVHYLEGFTKTLEPSLTGSEESSEQVYYLDLFPELLENASFNDFRDYEQEFADRIIEDGGLVESIECYDADEFGLNGWVLVSGDIIEDGVLKINGGTGSRYAGEYLTENTRKYIVRIKISNYVEGTLKLVDTIDTNPIGEDITSNGEYEFTYTASVDEGRLVMISDDGFIGHIEELSLKSFDTIDYIEYSNDQGDTGKIFVEDRCEAVHSTNRVTFINKFGVQQDLYFFKKSTETLNIEKKDYKSFNISNGVYSRTEHNVRDFMIDSNESITLSSGFVPEEYKEVFKQLFLSEKVWITNDDEVTYPVNIKTSSLNYKTRINDRLINYEIEFEKSYNTINNIR